MTFLVSCIKHNIKKNPSGVSIFSKTSIAAGLELWQPKEFSLIRQNSNKNNLNFRGNVMRVHQRNFKGLNKKIKLEINSQIKTVKFFHKDKILLKLRLKGSSFVIITKDV